MTRREQIAWAAGFFEGEGSITFSQSSAVWRIAVSNTDYSMLERFQAIVGVGSTYTVKRRDSKHKPCWQWAVGNGDDVWLVINMLWEFLSERRQDQILVTVAAREERRAQRKCSGCQGALDDKTDGCPQCYFRHWRRTHAA